MRRLVVGAVLTFGLLAASAGGAAAQVHGVSQAGCAHDPTVSGANQSSDNTPAAPIPVTASNGAAAAGSGGDGEPACDTAAEDGRQDR